MANASFPVLGLAKIFGCVTIPMKAESTNSEYPIADSVEKRVSSQSENSG